MAAILEVSAHASAHPVVYHRSPILQNLPTHKIPTQSGKMYFIDLCKERRYHMSKQNPLVRKTPQEQEICHLPPLWHDLDFNRLTYIGIEIYKLF